MRLLMGHVHNTAPIEWSLSLKSGQDIEVRSKLFRRYNAFTDEMPSLDMPTSGILLLQIRGERT
jgi:hypothetical protein